MDSTAEVDVISSGCEQFSADLYKNCVCETKGNIIVSPLTAYLLLSMSVNGADGETESQIRKGLRLSNDELQGLQGFQALIDSLNSVSDIGLAVASKIFVSEKFKVNPEFESILENYFRSKSERLNFSKKTEAVENVNTWCREQTKDHISEIVSTADINELSAMLMLNAIYFDGKWKYKFVKKNTKREKFHIDENNEKDIRMMKLRSDNLIYGEFDFIDAKFVELPYVSSAGNFRMVVIVPNKIDGLAEIENNLERINYKSLSESGNKEGDVEVKLPEFKFESKIDFKNYLMKMGMVDMFDAKKAKFAKMQCGESWPMWADKILQKALIEVNEEGTKAVVLTFQSMLLKRKYTPPPPPPKKTIHADRPYLMIIMYEKLPLFYARFTG